MPASCKLSQKIKISRRGHPNPSLPSEIGSFISISILSKRNIPRCLAPAKEKQAHTYRPHYSFIRGNSDQTQVYGAHRDSSVTTSSVNRIQHLEILSPSPWKSLLKPRILQIFPFSPVWVCVTKIKIVKASHSGDTENLKTFRLSVSSCFQINSWK